MTSRTDPPPAPPPAPAPANAHDVARLAGVSQSAVSRAFSEGASISPAMRAKVIAAAQALGYRPNLLARSLITRRSRLVGLVMGNIDNLFFPLVLDRLSARLSAAGLRLLLFTAEANAQVDRQIDALLHYRVDAVVLLSATLSSRLAAECREAGIPVILFNRTVNDLATLLSVTGDNRAGARAIAAHLLARGHRRLAFMAGYEASSTSQAREEGFNDHLREAGLPPPLRAVGGFSHDGAVAATRALLSAPTPPDAIFCANDQMAIAAIETARAEFGLERGRGLAVAGFDDIPMAAWPSLSLTTYSQPVDEMVAATVRLIGRIEDGDEPGVAERHVVVPGRLVVRQSA